MPKRKTVKGVQGRFKVTGRGKLVAFRAGRRHLLSGKRAKVKRRLRRPRVLAKTEVRKLKQLLYRG